MSNFITVAFVNQFSSVVNMLASQEGSRLIGTVKRESVTGEAWTVERLGTGEVAEINDRYAPMPLTELEHTRRWGYVTGFDMNQLIDRLDRAKTLIDPQNPYTVRASQAMGRAMDKTIINALSSDVKEGKNAEVTTPLPAAQTLTGTGVPTLARFLDLKELMDGSEVSEDRTVVYNARVIRQLMDDPKATSSDYNTLRLLESGQPNAVGPGGFLGFNRWIRTELAPKSGANNIVTAYTADALEFGTTKPMEVSIDRATWLRKIPTQVYVVAEFGATRVEDVRVARMICAPA
jgi:hypothetical protein